MNTPKILVSVIDQQLKFRYEGSTEFLPDTPQPAPEIDLSEDPADDLDCSIADNSISTPTVPRRYWED